MVRCAAHRAKLHVDVRSSRTSRESDASSRSQRNVRFIIDAIEFVRVLDRDCNAACSFVGLMFGVTVGSFYSAKSIESFERYI